MGRELKSPLGDGKNMIKNNLHAARKQSINVVIDLRRIKSIKLRHFQILIVSFCLILICRMGFVV